MNNKEAKEYIKLQEPTFLNRAKTGYVCPLCNNGEGHDGTGMTVKNGHYTCFRCNNVRYNDIFDLIGFANNIPNTDETFIDRLKWGCDFYGIMLNEEPIKIKQTEKRLENKAPVNPVKEEQEEDLHDYFVKCNETLINEYEGSYAQYRGLSLETVKAYTLGLDKDFTKMVKGAVKEALIIPTGKGTFNARNTDKNAEKGDRFRKTKGANAKLYNVEALHNSNIVFVVEGEIDALSIIEAGGQVVGLGGTSGSSTLIDYIASTPKKTADTYVYIRDNDEAGQNDAMKLQEALKEHNKQVFITTVEGGSKDVNDLLMKDRERLENMVKNICVNPAMYCDSRERNTIEQVIKFKEDVEHRQPSIPTGFKKLDTSLAGGLYEDFYILMAGTGRGKTALILQIADNIAKQEHRVLFYNLEMSTNELIARSISREAYDIAMEEGNGHLAFSSREIMDGSKYVTYGERERYIYDAEDEYMNYCNNIVFHEALGYYDTSKIFEEVEYYTAVDGKAPVVIVDYLQILSLGIALHTNKTLTERQAIDTAIYDLKSISRKFKTPVIAISSVNRESSKSNKALGVESAKESGNIEYTAGTLLSLDYTAIHSDTEKFDEEKEAQEQPRRMTVRILKNRANVPFKKIEYLYHSRVNKYVEQ